MSMTIDEIIAVLQAAKEGNKLQHRFHAGSIWIDNNDPCWDFSSNDYRIKPTLRTVPLSPEDVPPGSVIRHEGWKRGEWGMIVAVNSSGVMVQIGQNSSLIDMGWGELRKMQISCGAGEPFQRAEKTLKE